MRFKFASTQAVLEDSNLRIGWSNKGNGENCTVISFRAGANGWMRVNDYQMADTYKWKLSTASDLKWTEVRYLNFKVKNWLG